MVYVMIIAELSGRGRQSSSVLGGESQSLGNKDILSIGPVDTHWSYVYINSVRYIYNFYFIYLFICLFINLFIYVNLFFSEALP